MTDTEDNLLAGSPVTPPADLDWQQEKAKVRVKQFMNILEQLPRLCSPTICGTLSQPTTRAERNSRASDRFEWSLEQKAVLSPANITTDADWQNVAELNDTWRRQESDMFFSQRTIAPSPMAVDRNQYNHFQEIDEDDEDEDDDIEIDDHFDNNDDQIDLDDDNEDDDTNIIEGDDNDDTDIDYDGNNNDNEDNNLFFSPQPVRSSQSQQTMDIFSPGTFVRVMEDESTLQSTPKTTTGSQRARTRTRVDMLD